MERVGCANTVAVLGFLFVNFSGHGFLVLHFVLADNLAKCLAFVSV